MDSASEIQNRTGMGEKRSKRRNDKRGYTRGRNEFTGFKSQTLSELVRGDKTSEQRRKECGGEDQLSVVRDKRKNCVMDKEEIPRLRGKVPYWGDNSYKPFCTKRV